MELDSTTPTDPKRPRTQENATNDRNDMNQEANQVTPTAKGQDPNAKPSTNANNDTATGTLVLEAASANKDDDSDKETPIAAALEATMDGFKTVTIDDKRPQRSFREKKKANLAQAGLSERNRKNMVFLNLKVTVGSKHIKEGQAEGCLLKFFQSFFKEAKTRDPNFVLYKYLPEVGEPSAILETHRFPESFKTLQGEGPTNRCKGCCVHGLKIYNSKGKNMTIHTEMRVGCDLPDWLETMQAWIQTLEPKPYLRKKDLQAANTIEIGFLFGCNPLMRDRAVQGVLEKIVDNVT
jgi:hypothetical protein